MASPTSHGSAQRLYHSLPDNKLACVIRILTNVVEHKKATRNTLVRIGGIFTHCSIYVYTYMHSNMHVHTNIQVVLILKYIKERRRSGLEVIAEVVIGRRRAISLFFLVLN